MKELKDRRAHNSNKMNKYSYIYDEKKTIDVRNFWSDPELFESREKYMNLQLDQNQIGLGWEWGEYNEWEKATIQREKNVYIIFDIVHWPVVRTSRWNTSMNNRVLIYSEMNK